MTHIHLLDTAIATPNVGDEIIVERARAHLASVLEKAYVTVSSAHDGLGVRSLGMAKAADIVFLLGANKLSHSFLRSTKAMYISPLQLVALAGKVVLVGVGSYGYFERVSPAQRAFLRRLLSRDFVHSVRDSRALRILEACGIEGINTSCPTLWDYAEHQPVTFENDKRTVCFSLTCFNKDPENDRAMIEVLRSLYDRLIFWPQMPPDIPYLNQLTSTEDIEIVTPNLRAYDRMLGEVRPDIIGTRLHGSIRGLAFGCRVLVIAVDNRATDISGETGLPSIARNSVPDLLAPIVKDLPVPRLDIPASEIARFLFQFEAKSEVVGPVVQF